MEKGQRPTRGCLIWLQKGGQAITLEYNLPFGILQNKKKEYIRNGYKKEDLKITYTR